MTTNQCEIINSNFYLEQRLRSEVFRVIPLSVGENQIGHGPRATVRLSRFFGAYQSFLRVHEDESVTILGTFSNQPTMINGNHKLEGSEIKALQIGDQLSFGVKKYLAADDYFTFVLKYNTEFNFEDKKDFIIERPYNPVDYYVPEISDSENESDDESNYSCDENYSNVDENNNADANNDLPHLILIPLEEEDFNNYLNLRPMVYDSGYSYEENDSDFDGNNSAVDYNDIPHLMPLIDDPELNVSMDWQLNEMPNVDSDADDDENQNNEFKSSLKRKRSEDEENIQCRAAKKLKFD